MSLEIARHIPLWVYLLFGYLVLTGLQSLRPRTIGVRRMSIVPIVFIVWGLVGLIQRSGSVPGAFLYWSAGGAIGLALGIAWAVPMFVDHAAGRVRLPGSFVPLLRNVGLFAAHLALNVMAAVDAGARGQIMGYDLVVSGLGFGYFIGWLWRFASEYRAAAQTSLVE